MKNSEMSARNWVPEDAVGHLVEGPGGQVHQPGAVGDDQPAQQAAGEEVGHALGGVEEVEGVAGGRGVHHDQVVVALGVDLVEALHGDVVVALDEAARDVAVQRVGQDLLARLARRGRAGGPGRPSSPWCRAWPPTARPRGVTPAAAKTSSGIRRSVLPMPAARTGQPRASASRRAGSTVSTSTRPPWWQAAMAAAAAAVVVLPTPPGPQAMTISLAGRASEPVEAAGAGAAGGPGAPRCGDAAAGRPGHQNPSSSPSEAATWRVVRSPWSRRTGRAGTARAPTGRAPRAAAGGGRPGCAAW